MIVKTLLTIVIGFFTLNIQVFAQIVDSKEFEPVEKFAGGCPEGPPCSKTRGLIKSKPESNPTTDSPVDSESQSNIENKTDGSTGSVVEKPLANKSRKKAVGKKKELVKN